MARKLELFGELTKATSEAEKARIRAEMQEITRHIESYGNSVPPDRQSLPPAFDARGRHNYRFDPEHLAITLNRTGQVSAMAAVQCGREQRRSAWGRRSVGEPFGT